MRVLLVFSPIAHSGQLETPMSLAFLRVPKTYATR